MPGTPLLPCLDYLSWSPPGKSCRSPGVDHRRYYKRVSQMRRALVPRIFLRQEPSLRGDPSFDPRAFLCGSPERGNRARRAPSVPERFDPRKDPTRVNYATAACGKATLRQGVQRYLARSCAARTSWGPNSSPSRPRTGRKVTELDEPNKATTKPGPVDPLAQSGSGSTWRQPMSSRITAMTQGFCTASFFSLPECSQLRGSTTCNSPAYLGATTTNPARRRQLLAVSQGWPGVLYSPGRRSGTATCHPFCAGKTPLVTVGVKRAANVIRKQVS